MKLSNLSFVISAAVLLLTVSSCKKEESTCTLARITVSDGTSFYGDNVFKYDNNGRVTSIEYNNGSRDSIVYRADSIFVAQFDYRDTLVSWTEGLVNSTGDLLSAIRYNFANGSISGTEVSSFAYNSERQLTNQSVVTAGISNTTQITYQAGDKTTATTYTDTSLTATYFFEHSSTENKGQYREGNGALQPYLGIGDKHLISGGIKVSGTDTVRFEYEHTLNDAKYTTKTRYTQVRPFAGSIYYVYSYTCR